MRRIESTDVRVVNKMRTTVTFQLYQNGEEFRSSDSITMGMTSIFSEMAWNTAGIPFSYECAFYANNKESRVFIYGERVPRAKNRFELREQGVFLIERNGSYTEEVKIGD